MLFSLRRFCAFWRGAGLGSLGNALGVALVGCFLATAPALGQNPRLSPFRLQPPASQPPASQQPVRPGVPHLVAPLQRPGGQPTAGQPAAVIQQPGFGGGAAAGPGGGFPGNLASPSINGQLDAEIEKHFNDENLPGLVVLYARDGLLTYKKTLGFSDVENEVMMTEHRVGRLNSVSKWAAGIIALKQVEQGKFNLNATAKSYLADLPDHHTYTVQDLLACRSGVRHYGEATSPQSPSGWSGNQFDTAAAAAPMFWHDPLAKPVGAYHYSTHGYTIFGAALEQAVGQPIGDIIKSTLSTPYGLPTLKMENLSDNNPQRMKFYTKSGSGNVQVQPANSTWKVLGGGMESTPLDLLKLGILLGDGQIISQQNVKKMMTPLEFDNSYCLGCNHAVENGNHVMAKSGSFQGSNAYIWLVPDRRMVMVVMANRDEAGTSTLGRKLRNIILSADKAAGQKPDLVVQDFVRTGPVAHKDGKWEIPVEFKVFNQGAAGANELFFNCVQIGTTYRFSSYTDGLPPKLSRTVTGIVKLPDANKLYAGRTMDLVAFADAPIAGADTSVPWYGRVHESNESNNKATLKVQLPGGGLGLTGQTNNVPSLPGASVPQRLIGQPQQPQQPAFPARPQLDRPLPTRPQTLPTRPQTLPTRPQLDRPQIEPQTPERTAPESDAARPTRAARIQAILSSQPATRAVP